MKFLVLFIVMIFSFNIWGAGYKQDASKILNIGSISETLLDSSVQTKLNSSGSSSAIFQTDDLYTLEVSDTIEILGGHNITTSKTANKEITFDLNDALILNQQKKPSNMFLDDFESYGDTTTIISGAYSATDGLMYTWEYFGGGTTNAQTNQDYYASPNHSVDVSAGVGTKIPVNSNSTYIVAFKYYNPSVAELTLKGYLYIYADYAYTKTICYVYFGTGNFYYNGSNTTSLSGIEIVGWNSVVIIVHQDTSLVDVYLNDVNIASGKSYKDIVSPSTVALLVYTHGSYQHYYIDDFISDYSYFSTNPITWKYQSEWTIKKDFMSISKDTVEILTNGFKAKNSIFDTTEVNNILITSNRFVMPYLSSAPTDPITGEVYIDSGTYVLKVYDGSAWH